MAVVVVAVTFVAAHTLAAVAVTIFQSFSGMSRYICNIACYIIHAVYVLVSSIVWSYLGYFIVFILFVYWFLVKFPSVVPFLLLLALQVEFANF